MSSTTRQDESGFAPGDSLGPYTVERKLGSGGMAEVYFAVHKELNRPAALKVLRPSLAADEVHLQRFMQEARAAAGLIHPNIVQVYDIGREADIRYIAQEYIPGSNLRQYLNQSALPKTLASGPSAELDKTQPIAAPGTSQEQVAAATTTNPDAPPVQSLDLRMELPEALSVLLQVLAALSKSASSGIVHRDIKPENIMLTTDGDVKVADFGLARVLLADDPHLTRAGTTLGTPMYMSPEQIQDGQVDIRSDLYSLGVTLYHMLAGCPPFTGETPLALAMQHVQAKLPDIRQLRSDLPESLVQLTNRLLAKAPDDRFETPAEAIDFLRQHRQTDLADSWPDQTVPLPGAAQSHPTGPFQATLALRARLRRKTPSSIGGIATLVVSAVLLAACFTGGVFLAAQPELLADQPPLDPTTVAREATAKEQYTTALLSGEDSIDRLQAVERYHAGSSTTSEYWIAMAKLQIAHVYQQSGMQSQAQAQLEEIRSQHAHEKFVLTLAQLLAAEVAEDPTQDLETAKTMYLSLGDGNQQHVDLFAESVLSPGIAERWRPTDRPIEPKPPTDGS